jgi:hypothetical protein
VSLGVIIVGNTTVRQIYALVYVCPFKYLVVQAGGMRGGKTFYGRSILHSTAVWMNKLA